MGVVTAPAPLAPMVTVAVTWPSVALVGLESVRVKERVGLEPEGSKMGTLTFWTVSPGTKVSVPLVEV